MAAGPQLALASSVFTTPGDSRMAFGMINPDGTPVYGPTAVYVAPTPGAPAEGPFVAPADVLLTDKRYRSKQAATTADPFVAVYGADVKFPKKGKYAVLATTKKPDGTLTGATGQVDVSTEERRPDPGASASKAPKVHTDTLETRQGRRRRRSTRAYPPSDMHDVDFADVVGKKPVALLFSTPQLCQSRVCGPVTDMELQMKSKYGDQMDFIHQEVYVDNDINKGLREPLQEFNLPTEPWLFVVDAKGDDHRAPRGLDRRAAVRERGQVRAVRKRVLAALATAAGRRRRRARRSRRRTASSSASSCRSRSGCSRGRPRRCS